MKRNFLTVVATAATALFVGATVAQAASVEWGGSLRPRFEYNEQSNFNATNGGSTASPTASPNQGTQQSGDYFVSTQVRLHAKADILPDTSAFIQLQSVRTWGNNIGGTDGGANAGSGNAAFTGSDGDTSVGVHQAYFTLKNFATAPVDLKLGRQEVVLDGHRIIGNTVWTQGQQTHDAVRLTHARDNLTLAYVYSLANEGSRGSTLGSSINDDEDIEAHILYANMQGILGGGLSLYFVGLDDDCSAVSGVCTNGQARAAVGAAIAQNAANQVLDNNIYTVGVRQAGQLFGLDYRGEFYYQYGDAEGDALQSNRNSNPAGGAGTPFVATGLGVDRSAYMFGVRVGKKFNNVMWKPSIALWYDYKSGTSDDDARDGDFNTFNTLFDTGHKFYGLMDNFITANGSETLALGLVDYVVKTSITPAKGWTLKADLHHFTTAESVQANTNLSNSTPGGSDSNDLGQELDLTLVHKYNANTTISAGYSKYWQTSAFELVNANASSTATVTPADWAYLQFHVKF
jgi:alginate export protein